MEKKSSWKNKFYDDAQPIRHASFVEILRYAQRRDYILFGFGITLSMANGAISPLSSVFFRGMIDALMVGQANLENGTFNIETYTHSVLTYVYFYALLGVLIFLIGLSSMTCLLTLSERQAYEIRKRYFAALLKQEMAWYDKKEAGALTNKLSVGIERIKDGIGDKFGILLQAFTHLISGIIVAFYYSWRMTLLILLAAPIIILLLFGSIKALAVMTRQEMLAYDEASAVANEVISNIRTVTSFNAQYAEVVRYGDRLKYARKMGIKGIFITGIFTGFYIFVLFGSMGFIFRYGTNLVIEGEITPGTVFGVFWAIMLGAMRLGQAIPQLGVFTAAKLAAGEVFQIIDLEPNINCMSPHGLTPLNVEGRIEFHNIHFSYPARPNVKILNNISFTMNPGSTVALVGHSGCGKSTIIGLLLRFYEQQAGRITLDGILISDLNIEWLRNKIGLVSQEPVLFTATVEENLKLGNEALTENEMIEACKIANAHDFIMKLPKGYKTLVGVGGVQLSGGQKQRIAIARVLARDPKILLLDEATSALDSESEAAVQLALDRVRAGRTTITIAHRLSTIRNADKIIVFKNGEIMESGLHDELMALDGIYRQSVEEQEIGKGVEFVDSDNEQQLKNSEGDGKKDSKLNCRSEYSRKSIVSEKSHGNKTDYEDKKEFAKKELPIIIVALVFTIVRGLSWPVFSIVYGRTFLALSSLDIDKMIENTALNTILYLILGIVGGFSTFSSGALFGTAGEQISMRLRIAVFTNILRQDLSFFDNNDHSVGKLTTRLAVDAQNVKSAIDQRLAEVLQGIISLCAGIIVAFLFDWKMASIGFTICTILIILQSAVSQYLKIHGQKDIKITEKAASLASESIENIRTVQYLTKQKKMYQSYCFSLQEPHKRAIIRGFWQALSYAMSVSFMQFNFAISYFSGLWLVQNSWSKPYNIFQVIEALNVASFTVLAAASFLPEYIRARISANLTFHIKNYVPLIDNLSENGIQQPLKGNIQLKDVCFAYPMLCQHTVLRKFSMSAMFGQKIALVGSSGCGKSTVIKLLERFYDVTEGVLLVDNRDIKSYNVRYLRSHIAVVDQEPTLFNISIRDNIAYGLDDASQNQIEAAAKLANIHNFIVALPQGYDTIVGSKGSQLSGGQKQRIAIARAVIRNPKILLLDEATSALDSGDEKIVQEALEAARHGRTCIVIAHRLKTVQNSDLIIVLKDGEMVECGNHTQLLAQKRLYYCLIEKQKVLQDM
ncbi:ABC transporter transmembrane region family protein [Acanthocheilonema viteae]